MIGTVTTVTAGCQEKSRKCWNTGQGPSLRDLKDIQLAGVLERLSPIAEPDPHHLSVIVELLSNLGDLLARRQWVFFKIGIKSLDSLWCEGGAALAFFGGFATHKLHQVLLAFLVSELCLVQPLLQDWLQLLGTLGRDVQLLKPAEGPMWCISHTPHTEGTALHTGAAPLLPSVPYLPTPPGLDSQTLDIPGPNKESTTLAQQGNDKHSLNNQLRTFTCK